MKLRLANTLRFIGVAHYYASVFCQDLAEFLDPQLQKHYEKIMNVVQNAVRTPGGKPGEQN